MRQDVGNLLDSVKSRSPRPLAERLRPESLDDWLGPREIVGKIRALLAAPRLPSILLFGPPGCGKSSLAVLTAKACGRPWARVSAPDMGIPELRSLVAKTPVLVLDEIHRFSKAQQDFFLSRLETGELTLLASTTEDPSFTVTPQMLSRLYALKIPPVAEADILGLVRRGAGLLNVKVPEDVVGFLAGAGRGDARFSLSLLEYCACLPVIDMAGVKKIMPDILARHDKKGSSHYEIASALIKSIRGSDVDAAIYWAACLIDGGEDPRFITRRLMIAAAEDIGLADPEALRVASACHKVVREIGMPEGRIPIAETVAYLALAPKSNSAYKAMDRALSHIREHGQRPVPLHLRNAVTGLHRRLGNKEGYLYPHDFGGFCRQEHLPRDVPGGFFEQGENGRERDMGLWLAEFSEGGEDPCRLGEGS